MNSNLVALHAHSLTECVENQDALRDLFELYLVYGVVDTYSSLFLKVDTIYLCLDSIHVHKSPSSLFKYGIIDSEQLNRHQTRLFELLKRVRVNALALVDSFDWSDSHLCK